MYERHRRLRSALWSGQTVLAETRAEDERDPRSHRSPGEPARGCRHPLRTNPDSCRGGRRDHRTERSPDRGARTSGRSGRRDRERARVSSSAGPAGRELAGRMSHFPAAVRPLSAVRCPRIGRPTMNTSFERVGAGTGSRMIRCRSLRMNIWPDVETSPCVPPVRRAAGGGTTSQEGDHP